MTNRIQKEFINDAEIDYMNKKRKISLELSTEERLLYGYTKTISLKELENIRKKYESELELYIEPGVK